MAAAADQEAADRHGAPDAAAGLRPLEHDHAERVHAGARERGHRLGAGRVHAALQGRGRGREQQPDAERARESALPGRGRQGHAEDAGEEANQEGGRRSRHRRGSRRTRGRSSRRSSTSSDTAADTLRVKVRTTPAAVHARFPDPGADSDVDSDAGLAPPAVPHWGPAGRGSARPARVERRTGEYEGESLARARGGGGDEKGGHRARGGAPLGERGGGAAGDVGERDGDLLGASAARDAREQERDQAADPASQKVQVRPQGEEAAATEAVRRAAPPPARAVRPRAADAGGAGARGERGGRDAITQSPDVRRGARGAGRRAVVAAAAARAAPGETAVGGGGQARSAVPRGLEGHFPDKVEGVISYE